MLYNILHGFCFFLFFKVPCYDSPRLSGNWWVSSLNLPSTRIFTLAQVFLMHLAVPWGFFFFPKRKKKVGKREPYFNRGPQPSFTTSFVTQADNVPFLGFDFHIWHETIGINDLLNFFQPWHLWGPGQKVVDQAIVIIDRYFLVESFLHFYDCFPINTSVHIY